MQLNGAHPHQAKGLCIALLSRTATVTQQFINAAEKRAGPVGDPQEAIRTYNVPRDRATDHRCNVTIQPLADVLAGHLDPFIHAMNG